MRRFRALLLADGSSDAPLRDHVAARALRHGAVLDVTAPEFEWLRPAPGRGVGERLRRALELDPNFELLIIHRDSEGRPRESRVQEIDGAVGSSGIDWPCIPIIPIRMTEAWLLTDERAIRAVAGRPSGTDDLGLPPPRRIEEVSDPKAILTNALRIACGLRGRRLRTFERDFGHHRRSLLERLDRSGPVRELTAWQALEDDTRRAVGALMHSP